MQKRWVCTSKVQPTGTSHTGLGSAICIDCLVVDSVSDVELSSASTSAAVHAVDSVASTSTQSAVSRTVNASTIELSSLKMYVLNP